MCVGPIHAPPLLMPHACEFAVWAVGGGKPLSVRETRVQASEELYEDEKDQDHDYCVQEI